MPVGYGIEKCTGFYKAQSTKLEKRIKYLSRQADALSQVNGCLASTEEVLLSLSQRQEWIAHVLQRLKDAAAAAADSSNNSSGCEHAKASAALSLAALPDFSTCYAGTDSYSLQLLRVATRADWQRAMTITVEGWCAFYSSLAAKLLTYQNLLNREDAVTAAATGQHPLTNSTTTTTATTTGGSGGAIASGGAAAAAAAQLVDEFCTMIVLSHLSHNMMSYRHASHINLSTGRQAENMPESHWQRVVEASQLSEQQVQHLQESYAFFMRHKQALQYKVQVASTALAQATERTVQHFNNTSAMADTLQAPVTHTANNETRGSTGGSDAAGAGPETEEQLQAKLQGLLTNLQLLNLLVFVDLIDVLSPVQRMRWVGGCYPVLPRLLALLETVAHMYQQHPDKAGRSGKQQQQHNNNKETHVVVADGKQQAAGAPAAAAAATAAAAVATVGDASPASAATAAAAVAVAVAAAAPRGALLVLQRHQVQLQRRQTQLAQQHQDFWQGWGKRVQELQQAFQRVSVAL